MKAYSDRILGTLIRTAHERLGLTPNQVSSAGLAVSLAAGGVASTGRPGSALALMALSQIIDGVDGGIARRYGLHSAKGRMFDTVCDRVSELAIFFGLALGGAVSFRMAILSSIAILLVTMVEPKSKFDPGFKRFILYFGWLAGVIFGVQGFELAMNVIFLANLTVFAVGTVIVEYRHQREMDDAAILERERMRAAGMQRPPDDPPSLLSRLASWL